MRVQLKGRGWSPECSLQASPEPLACSYVGTCPSQETNCEPKAKGPKGLSRLARRLGRIWQPSPWVSLLFSCREGEWLLLKQNPGGSCPLLSPPTSFSCHKTLSPNSFGVTFPFHFPALGKADSALAWAGPAYERHFSVIQQLPKQRTHGNCPPFAKEGESSFHTERAGMRGKGFATLNYLYRAGSFQVGNLLESLCYNLYLPFNNCKLTRFSFLASTLSSAGCHKRNLRHL